MRTRRLALALVATPLSLGLLAGCGPLPGAAAVTAATAPSPGLRTASPAPMSTVDGVAKAIVANVTVPAAGVGRVSRADATSAVEWLGTYLAQAHADPAWLCATETTASPTRRHATSALLKRLASDEGERARHGLEPQLAKKGQRDCAAVSWVAPGIVAGPQQLTLVPGRDGDDLRVVYRGRFGYRLVAKDGREQPWGGDYRATYGLVLHGKEWRLNSAPESWASLAPAWPDPLTLPAGYAERAVAPDLPGADAGSLAAVREAVRKTLAVPVATWSYTTDVDRRGTRSTSRGEGPVAFGRGDALIRQDNGGIQLHLDHGRTHLTALTGPVTPVPGESLPRSPRWWALDPAKRPVLLHRVEDPSPFVNLAVVGIADAAAQTQCPAGAVEAHPERCYTVRVPMGAAAYGDGITARFGWGYLVHGHVWLTMDVGADADGRLVYVHRRATVPSFGSEWSVVAVTGTVTGFTGTAPVAPIRPAAATIAHDGTFDARD